MAGNSGGPWGGGGNNGGGGGDDDRGNRGGGRRPGDDGPQIPEIEELMKKGQEQLKVLMGGRGGDGARRNGGGGGQGGNGPGLTRGTVLLGVLAAVALWAYASFYTVKPEEQSIELFLGEYSDTGNPGLNFAPWPVTTYEILPVTREQTENIGTGDTDIFNAPVFPKGEQRGYGFHEAPRGTLSHWVVIKDGKIDNYQAVVPSTWNAGPRDEDGNMGPYEASLMGNPIADNDRPLEVVRTIHSFDPCLACAIHTHDAEGKPQAVVKVL